MGETGQGRATLPDQVVFTTAEDLGVVRGFVLDRAVAAGLALLRAQLLTLAVSELMSNTLEHTGSGGVVRVWTEPGSLVCEVQDLRPGGSRPVEAPLMPPADSMRGRGLAIIEQVCDAVSLPGDGSVVRLRMTC